MSKSKLAFLSLLILLCSNLILPLSSFAQTQTETEETLTFTTYYPAPYGVYNEMRLFPHTPASSCDSTKIGTMYYDSTPGENQIKVCTDEGWKNIGGGVLAKYEVFDSPVTFIVPAGVTKIMVEVWGGGGGGGGGSGSPGIGGGGGAGGYGKGIFTVTPGGSYSVTVGAGGASGGAPGNNGVGNTGGSSSFGSLIVCNGGIGGSNNKAGGAGGTCSAPINVSGGDGISSSGYYLSSGGAAGGGGGAGGSGASDGYAKPATEGEIPGGGGGAGGDGQNESAAGAQGRVIVWY